MTKIFVYGSLLRGFGNWSWALRDQTFIGTAETLPEYEMISLGGFPGVLSNGNTAIQGEVFEVDDARLRQIDTLEGADRTHPMRGMYRAVEITLADGTEVWTYLYNSGDGANPGSRHIPSGSWREYTGRYLKNRC
jgi:gamma-glutamylcyclotransferase (GGCT)/AIG2-like uncharacterized protein YtfP